MGEALLRVRHCADRRRARCRSSEIETVVSHPQVPGQCARFLRGELPRARDPRRRARRPRRCAAWSPRRDDATGGARDGAGRRDLRRRRCCARASRTATTTKRGSCGWPARPTPRRPRRRCAPRAASRAARSSSGAPGRGHPGWLVRCLDEFARARDQPARRSSRARGASSSASYMFFAELQGARARRARSPPRSTGCAGSANACSCSAPTAPPRPRGPPVPTAPEREPERLAGAGVSAPWRRRSRYTAGADHGEHSPTRAGGVRVAN